MKAKYGKEGGTTRYRPTGFFHSTSTSAPVTGGQQGHFLKPSRSLTEEHKKMSLSVWKKLLQK
jgi:hypothetical protein